MVDIFHCQRNSWIFLGTKTSTIWSNLYTTIGHKPTINPPGTSAPARVWPHVRLLQSPRFALAQGGEELTRWNTMKSCEFIHFDWPVFGVDMCWSINLGLVLIDQFFWLTNLLIFVDHFSLINFWRSTCIFVFWTNLMVNKKGHQYFHWHLLTVWYFCWPFFGWFRVFHPQDWQLQANRVRRNSVTPLIWCTSDIDDLESIQSASQTNA